MNSRTRARRLIADAVTATIAAQILDTCTALSEDQAHAAAHAAAHALQDDGWCIHAPATTPCTTNCPCPCPCQRPTATPAPQQARQAVIGTPRPTRSPR